MLSGPHRKFAEGIAAGLNATKAYQAAYPTASYAAARAKASALVTKGNIVEEVDRIRSKADEIFTMTHTEWLESFARIGKKAEDARDFAAARGCLREIGLARPGWYAKETVKVEAELDIVVRIGAPREP